MNRIIKFRAWDEKIKRFHYFDCDQSYRAAGWWEMVIAENMPVSQFTGLVDVNMDQIFEGDIVSWGQRMHEVVINFNGYYLQRYKLWRGKFVPSQRYGMSLITKPGKDDLNGVVDRAEVVGNIYENFDLLKRA